jgi:methionine--tRNA ligase beta chain
MKSERRGYMATYDDFMKLELKIAKVLEAEEVPEASKLLKLKIDIGGETRQIVAGIKKNYQPQDLVGREIVVIANLEPRIVMGVESQGMLLAASDETGPVLLRPDKDVPLGSRVK